jgi:recombination protein RecR
MDVVALERTGEFRGRYHVLKGALSPVDGVGPEQLRLDELRARIKGGTVSEVIVATNPTAQGEATALYIARILQSEPGLKVTRIARGVPMGSDLEFSDQVTLARALAGRKEI